MNVQYSSNNSGGDWWLSDDDWRKLEAAGWAVEWKKDSDSTFVQQMLDEEGRYLGALATSATKDFPTENMAIAEWEHVTGQNADEVGCTCCGQPHNFYSK